LWEIGGRENSKETLAVIPIPIAIDTKAETNDPLKQLVFCEEALDMIERD
jgi:hypothetical protein